ncbi:MAG: PIG-L family deacetylase [Rhodoferax sp.]|nr:PIG-L family deacetylase [Rhodoferax sp.]
MDSSPSRAPSRAYYRAVFISPHLDDAVFSCGGMIAKLVREGPVLVLNLFTRYLSEVKIRGVVLGEERYQEEADAARFLGFESRCLGELDVSFRRDAYRKLGNIFRPPVAEDLAWLPTLRQKVFELLAELDYQQLYVPLGIGWHVDHVLTHQLFEPWAERSNLLYYEDAPYCCIPHSTRYRLNEVGVYPCAPGDLSLAPMNETRAWWQSSMAYANTALMKNLRPWIVRKFAIPVVSFYLHRLMALHRSHPGSSAKRGMEPLVMPINEEFDSKVEAMCLYRSQFREFFADRGDCVSTLAGYGNSIRLGSGRVERYWK